MSHSALGGNHRRTFLQVAGTTVAATGLSRPTSDSTAEGRVRVGIIGLGGQGTGHLNAYLSAKNVNVVYVCDPDSKRLAKAAEKASNAKPVSDLRKVLDDTTVDAVSIATPDHWHTPAALLALDAGKHVYVEKPCSHNVREGRLLVEAAKRTGQIVHHGTQTRSSPSFQKAVQMLRDGIIGDVFIARAWNIQRRGNIGKMRPSRPPSGFDYDLWTGPAPMVPFQKNRHHYNWHWWFNFGTGDAGNDGIHEIDLARWALGVQTHPAQVAVAGGKFFHNDDQEFADTITATFQYLGDGSAKQQRQLVFEMRLWSTNYPYNVDSGVDVMGTKGRMFLSKRGKFKVWGERNRRVETDLDGSVKVDFTAHVNNFLDAIRQKTTTTADAYTAHLSATLPHLANIGARIGRSFEFDASAERIAGDSRANSLLGRTYRDTHWATPENT